MSSKKNVRAFEALLVRGHKGEAVIVPFDPAEEWGIAATPVTSKVLGTRPGHLVKGKLNGHPFDG